MSLLTRIIWQQLSVYTEFPVMRNETKGRARVGKGESVYPREVVTQQSKSFGGEWVVTYGTILPRKEVVTQQSKSFGGEWVVTYGTILPRKKVVT